MGLNKKALENLVENKKMLVTKKSLKFVVWERVNILNCVEKG